MTNQKLRVRTAAPRLVVLGALSACLLWPEEAAAVRPFVTDDARISDYGQYEVELWLETSRLEVGWVPGFAMMHGMTFADWIQVIGGVGVGVEPDGTFTVSNAVIQPKLLFWRADERGVPGLALGVGVALPFGRGALFEPATGIYAIAMTTTRLLDDWLLLHFNGGAKVGISGDDGARARAYWGVGFDVGVGWHPLRLIGEVYAGDPFEPIGAPYALQWGSRYLVSDFVAFDLTFGAEPDHNRDGFNWWGQLGVRLLFDIFTRDGRPGDPNGPPGMWVY